MPYRTVAKETTCRLVIRRSVFIAFVREVETDAAARAFLSAIKAGEPQADHHCYAYRLGKDKAESIRFNDDGEPAGTAGRPILGAILASGTTNVMVVIARYFGGKKLGVPGLIEAYRAAAVEALTLAGSVEREYCFTLEINTPYNLLEKVRHLLRGLGAGEVGVSFGTLVTVSFQVPCEAKAAAANVLSDLGLTPVIEEHD